MLSWFGSTQSDGNVLTAPAIAAIQTNFCDVITQPLQIAAPNDAEYETVNMSRAPATPGDPLLPWPGVPVTITNCVPRAPLGNVRLRTPRLSEIQADTP